MSEASAEDLGALGIVDNPRARRYEARLGGRVVAASDYRLVGERVVFLHTVVEEDFEGRGVGSRLVAGALDDIRRRGLRVTAKCPFVAAYVESHPEYAPLIAP